MVGTRGKYGVRTADGALGVPPPLPPPREPLVRGAGVCPRERARGQTHLHHVEVDLDHARRLDARGDGDRAPEHAEGMVVDAEAVPQPADLEEGLARDGGQPVAQGLTRRRSGDDVKGNEGLSGHDVSPSARTGTRGSRAVRTIGSSWDYMDGHIRPLGRRGSRECVGCGRNACSPSVMTIQVRVDAAGRSGVARTRTSNKPLASSLAAGRRIEACGSPYQGACIGARPWGWRRVARPCREGIAWSIRSATRGGAGPLRSPRKARASPGRSAERGAPSPIRRRRRGRSSPRSCGRASGR